MQQETAMKTNQEDIQQIRELCDSVVNGIRVRNVDQVMRAYDENVVQFDVRSPLAQKGASEVRKTTQEWLSSREGPLECEVRDLTIAADGDVAFAHSFNRTAGTGKDGQRSEMWVRWTGCFRKTKGAWKLTHEHVSVPFDPKTMKADLGLTPDR
jgi:uncharacterized protein (TIGR02246 family)